MTVTHILARLGHFFLQKHSIRCTVATIRDDVIIGSIQQVVDGSNEWPRITSCHVDVGSSV